MTLRPGELVTVDLGEHNSSSNTYQVARKLDGEALLAHPLFPDCFILKKDEELNHVLAQLKGPTERCLDYAKKYKSYLNYDDSSEVESLCLYFVVKRTLSARQKKNLSNICGQIAAVYCQNDLSLGARIVNENTPLLDHFNLMWYQNFEKIFRSQKPIKTQAQRAAIFNIVGFVLAQLESGSS